MTPQPVDPHSGMLMRLREEAAKRTDKERDKSRDLASALAQVAVTADDPSSISETLRSVAVGLAASRQLFLATGHLSDRDLEASLPIIGHLSMIAEGLVTIADDIAVDEMLTADPDRDS